MTYFTRFISSALMAAGLLASVHAHALDTKDYRFYSKQ